MTLMKLFGIISGLNQHYINGSKYDLPFSLVMIFIILLLTMAPGKRLKIDCSAVPNGGVTSNK